MTMTYASAGLQEGDPGTGGAAAREGRGHSHGEETQIRCASIPIDEQPVGVAQAQISRLYDPNTAMIAQAGILRTDGMCHLREMLKTLSQELTCK